VDEFIVTFKEYLLRMKAASYTLGDMMKALEEGSGSR
jgi:hypothetical protein